MFINQDWGFKNELSHAKRITTEVTMILKKYKNKLCIANLLAMLNVYFVEMLKLVRKKKSDIK